MKKALIISACCLAIVGTISFVFREQLFQSAIAAISADMYVAGDNDAFDPGVAIGSTFPAINARLAGEVITSIAPLIHDKGMVFIANRSASW